MCARRKTVLCARAEELSALCKSRSRVERKSEGRVIDQSVLLFVVAEVSVGLLNTYQSSNTVLPGRPDLPGFGFPAAGYSLLAVALHSSS